MRCSCGSVAQIGDLERRPGGARARRQSSPALAAAPLRLRPKRRDRTASARSHAALVSGPAARAAAAIECDPSSGLRAASASSAARNVRPCRAWATGRRVCLILAGPDKRRGVAVVVRRGGRCRVKVLRIIRLSLHRACFTSPRTHSPHTHTSRKDVPLTVPTQLAPQICPTTICERALRGVSQSRAQGKQPSSRAFEPARTSALHATALMRLGSARAHLRAKSAKLNLTVKVRRLVISELPLRRLDTIAVGAPVEAKALDSMRHGMPESVASQRTHLASRLRTHFLVATPVKFSCMNQSYAVAKIVRVFDARQSTSRWWGRRAELAYLALARRVAKAR